MSYYPVFLELKDKHVLVVGGGAVAERKVETLLEHGASVRVTARTLTQRMEELVSEKRVEFLGEEFVPGHLEGAVLVFAATDDNDLNHRVSEMARHKGVFVNAADQPSDCDFIVPSMIRKGDLCIAISTSGKSPALARKIRSRLARQFGKEYEAFVMLMGRLRSEVLALGLDQKENSRIFYEIVSSDILSDLRENDREAVAYRLRKVLPAEVNVEEVLNDLGLH